MKLSKRSISIKKLIKEEVSMGVYGLVELELMGFDNEISTLKKTIDRLESEKLKTYITNKNDERPSQIVLPSDNKLW